MVFQQFYLFPHLTALENVMFGPLRVRGASKQAAEKQAKELLAKVGLAERAHHYPSELSGGQQAACGHRPRAGGEAEDDAV